MNPAEKALWYIESHLNDAVTLDMMAAAIGLSRFHLSRAFTSAFGVSPVRYARRRRLSEAAIALAKDGGSILNAGLEAGYGSHEAFSRAFETEFGLTPKAFRQNAPIHEAQLQKAIAMKAHPEIVLATPAILDHDPIRLAGLNRRYSDETSSQIPKQWAAFAASGLTHELGFGTRDTFGVLHNSDDAGNTDYFCGLEVRDYSDLPNGADRLTVPAQTYAVFAHPGHVSEVKRVWSAVWNDWIPASDYLPAGGPEFERYGEAFDPETGNGGFEIWVPVKPKA